MINLDEMFGKCLQVDEVLRVDPEYVNEIYVGNNTLFQRTLIVRGVSRQRKVKSSKNIHAEIIVKDEDVVSLSFSLLDNRYMSIFYKFCEDIIMNSKNIKFERIIVHTIARWNVWKLMFEKSQNDFLSESQIVGLLGELLFMKNYLIVEYGIESAISSWTGPEGNPKDFYCNDKWYEVKTISESKQSITISSIEQLDSNDSGVLVVNRLQKTTKEDKHSVNLNSIAFQIINIIDDPYLLELFNTKLGLVGYCFYEEYQEICFTHKKSIYYEVDENFPRIRRDMISKEITKVSYDMLLVNLKEMRTETWS